MGAIQDWVEKVKFMRPHVTSQDPPHLIYPQPFYLFRGESKKWKQPISSRWSREKKPTERRERNYYQRCFAKLFPESSPFYSDLNLQFIAFLQHHGFKTRLIDATSSLEAALFFVVHEDENSNETGYLYKLFGYNIDSIAEALDQADIESVFFNPKFPPHDHPIIKERPRPYIFYRDTNSFNLNARRQDGWFVLQTKNYRAHSYRSHAYPITPQQKQDIRTELNKLGYDKSFYFPNTSKIAKETR